MLHQYLRWVKTAGILILFFTAVSCSDVVDRDRNVVLCYNKILEDPLTTAQCRREAAEICVQINTPMPLTSRIRYSIHNVKGIICDTFESFDKGCVFQGTQKECVAVGVQNCKDINIFPVFPCLYRDCIERALSRCEVEYKLVKKKEI